MASSRTIIIAGAGIGGLSAALMVAQAGFRVTLVEQAERLEETGAGIQLSPNVTRILIELGLGERLQRDAFVPAGVTIRTASGSDLTRFRLGEEAERRYGAPYWCIHRADLQAALLEAVSASPDIVLRLGTRFEDFVVHAHGVSAACRRRSTVADEHGIGLVGADGLWSAVRARLDKRTRPEFRQRTAWRALIPADKVAAEFRSDSVQLWLGHNAHLVLYPVKAGTLVNVVAIVEDRWSEPGWSAEGDRQELLEHFSPWHWSEPVREFLMGIDRWLKWALFDLAPLSRWGEGPVTLLGDAAHPMLPFLAQGAAMAIEDGAVLATMLVREPDNPASAMRRYERVRRGRAARVQREARRNGRIYHQTAGEALLRNLFLRTAGGFVLPRRYKWLYDRRIAPPPRVSLDALPPANAGEE